MATLAQNINLNIYGEARTEMWVCDSSSAQVIYQGVAMMLDANVDTVNVRIADGVTGADADTFIGVANGYLNIALGDTEDSKHAIEVLVAPTIVGFPSTAVTNADAGKTIYASAYTASGVTLSTSNGTYPPLGKLRRVENGYAYIELVSPAVMDVP